MLCMSNYTDRDRYSNIRRQRGTFWADLMAYAYDQEVSENQEYKKESESSICSTWTSMTLDEDKVYKSYVLPLYLDTKTF
jgi:hypothetical protein